MNKKITSLVAVLGLLVAGGVSRSSLVREHFRRFAERVELTGAARAFARHGHGRGAHGLERWLDGTKEHHGRQCQGTQRPGKRAGHFDHLRLAPDRHVDHFVLIHDKGGVDQVDPQHEQQRRAGVAGFLDESWFGVFRLGLVQAALGAVVVLTTLAAAVLGFVSAVAAYGGFPTRYPHWRFGMEYERLSKGYEYGLSKIYEMVINNDPCYAYLLEGNSTVEQKLVVLVAMSVLMTFSG